MDILSRWSGNPTCSLITLSPFQILTLYFISWLCLPPVPRTILSPGGVLNSQEREDGSRLGELCPSPLTSHAAQTNKRHLCHSKSAVVEPTDENRRPEGQKLFPPQLLPVLLLHRSLPLSFSPFLFLQVNLSASGPPCVMCRSGRKETRAVCLKIPFPLPPKHSKRKFTDEPAAPPGLAPSGQCHQVDTTILRPPRGWGAVVLQLASICRDFVASQMFNSHY